MNINKASILQLVIDEIEILNGDLENKVNLENGNETRLFGGDGILDSLSLVALIIAIEERLEIETGRSIVLANEKAMSKRISPFSSISKLCEYIEEILLEI
jgi:acyl carrier protein